MNKNLKRDINFFIALGKDKGKATVDFNKQIRKTLLIFAAVAFVSIVVILVDKGFQSINKANWENKVESVATEERLKEIQATKEKSEKLADENKALKSKIDEYAGFEKLLIEDIENVARLQINGLFITSFAYNEGILTLACYGTSEQTGPDFANALRQSNKFTSVEYTGMSAAEEGKYPFSVSLSYIEETTEAPTETTTKKEDEE